MNQFEGVSAADYDNFMGRFSAPLGELFADFAGIPLEGRLLDVGCGPGALTRILVSRRGSASVVACDPAAGFVDAAQERFPDVEVVQARAEDLPFDDHAFAAVYAELVVHFLEDPAAGISEMVRTAASGGVVAACVWDFENARAPHSSFAVAVSEVTGHPTHRLRAGTRAGDLSRLLLEVGCGEVIETTLTVAVTYDSFEQCWHTHTRGIGSSAALVRNTDESALAEIRALSLSGAGGEGPYTVEATAWAARGIAP